MTTQSYYEIQEYRKSLDKLLIEYEMSKRQINLEEDNLLKSRNRLESIQKAQSIVQQIAKTIQETCHRQVSEIASRCLQAVFGKNTYTLEIIFEEKRGKTEANIVLKKEDMILEDPINECGGGVVDIISFSLRLASLILTRPQRRRVLIMDEPWKHLSAKYRPHLRELVETLSEDMNIQIIYVTHAEDLMIGKVEQVI